MIISDSNSCSSEDFRKLINETYNSMNSHAFKDQEYYIDKSGTKLENEVFKQITSIADNLNYKIDIRLYSGLKFPDITINNIYGIEVKSSLNDSWVSTGNSILESNRIPNIDKIYIFFGKLTHPISFKYKLYEDCLSDIRVTHSPRYTVDMNLSPGETIFHKIGISYNDFRNLPHPIEKLKEYYKNNSKTGEYTWWIDQDKTAPIKLRFLNHIPTYERIYYILTCLILYPEIFSSNNATKFQNAVIYLLNNFSIISPNIRDSFTAGGQFTYITNNRQYNKVPKIFKILIDNKQLFIELLIKIKRDEAASINQLLNIDNRIILTSWIDEASKEAITQFKDAENLLHDIFFDD